MDSWHSPCNNREEMSTYIRKVVYTTFNRRGIAVKAIASAMAFVFYIVSFKLNKEIRSLFAPDSNIREGSGQLEPDLAKGEVQEAPFSLYNTRKMGT